MWREREEWERKPKAQIRQFGAARFWKMGARPRGEGALIGGTAREKFTTHTHWKEIKAELRKFGN